MTDIVQKYKSICAKNNWHIDHDQMAAITALNVLETELAVEKKFWNRLRNKKTIPGGVYLYGGVGRGKTFVMDLFFQNTTIKQKRRCHFHEFMIEVHERLHQKRSNRNDEDTGSLLKDIATDISANMKLLCFDEMFVDDVADAMLLGRLFTALFENGVGIVFTSNIEPDHLYPNGLQRERFIPFIELLKQHTAIIHFDGLYDYRANRLKDHKRYIYPLGPQVATQMSMLFDEFADGKTSVRTDVEVKGRVLSFPRTVNGVLFTRFDALCAAAMGAEDYLALCEQFSTFIIQDVPVLDDLKRNEVKRFITLIDTLYEKKRLTFISAEQAVEYIYEGKQYAAAFERTQSRIMEMQSPEYPDG